MFTAEDILKGAKLIIPHLLSLLGEDAEQLELELLALLARAEEGDAVDNQILELLAQHDATRDWMRQYLADKIPSSVTRKYSPKSDNQDSDSKTENQSNTLQCYIHAEMDEAVIVQRVTTLEVSLSRELIAPTQSSTSQTDSAQVQANKSLIVQIIPKANFSTLEDDRIEVDPPAVGEPLQLYFDLRPTHVGEGEVWVIVRQGQFPLCNLKLKPKIVQNRSEMNAIIKINARSNFSGSTNFREIPHQLSILELKRGNEIFYRYELRSPYLNLLEAFESKPIKGERAAYVRSLYKEIEEQWISSGDDVKAFAAELRAFGGHLYDQLFPSKLQKILWQHRDTIDSIMVLSDEPFIPWELFHLKPASQSHLPEETIFLGQMGLVRWLYDAQGWPPELIKIRAGKARYLIPNYPVEDLRLPQAEQESQFLKSKFVATLVEAQPNPLRDLISKPGQFDLLHFAGHGSVETDEIASARLLLGGRMKDNSYISTDFSSIKAEQFSHFDEENRPLIVINACQTGRSGNALTGMGGFAQAFLRGGAGAFVAPLWSVGDWPARIFTEALYTELLKGKPLAKATTLARKQAGLAGDSTWLAYAVYGHPNLKIEQSE